METTIKQISRVTATASIHQVFDAGAYTCTSDTNVVNDTIQNINLSITPKNQQPESPTVQMQNGMPTVGYYARAEWNAVGQTSYFFNDKIPAIERNTISEIFDAVFAEVKGGVL